MYFGQVMYVDCHELYGGVIKLAMAGRVGVGLHPDDDGVKVDVYHTIEKIDDHLQPGSLLSLCLESFCGRYAWFIILSCSFFSVYYKKTVNNYLSFTGLPSTRFVEGLVLLIQENRLQCPCTTCL